MKNTKNFRGGRGAIASLLALALIGCNAQPTPNVPIATSIPPAATLDLPTMTPKELPTSSALSSPIGAGRATTSSPPVATRILGPAAVASGTAKPPIRGWGKIIGRAVQPPGRVGHPSFIVSGELYLGQYVPASDPKLPPAIAVSPVDAPHAQVDQTTGDFVFTDVAPGKYALVMIGFSESFVFEKPNGGGGLEVVVEADKITNLGNVTLK